MHLGTLSLPRSEWRRLSSMLEARLAGQTSLLEEEFPAITEAADKAFAHYKFVQTRRKEQVTQQESRKIVPVDLQSITTGFSRSFFEGSCRKNTLAKRGKSKEKRSDCPLVTLALVVDQFGFPVFCQIYGGKQSEPKTLEEILDELHRQGEELFKESLPTIVMDRGIATKENIELLRAKHYPYIVIERRPVQRDYPEEFQSVRDTFERIIPDNEQTIYVKKVPFDGGLRVLCYSEGRELKEQAISALAEKRFFETLGRLQKSVAKGSILHPEKVAQRLGRLKERHPAAARLYEITMEVAEKKVTGLKVVKKPAAQLVGSRL